MTKNTPDGGLAFPNTEVWHPTTGDPIWQGQAGMTLRDYFAAKAMQGMLATPAGTQMADEAHLNPDRCAEWAYQQADAMLAERAKIADGQRERNST